MEAVLEDGVQSWKGNISAFVFAEQSFVTIVRVNFLISRAL